MKVTFSMSFTINYQIENLMFLEQDKDSIDFITTAIKLKESSNDMISSYLLYNVVKHGLVTREDDKSLTNKLESVFFKNVTKKIMIERIKNTKEKK